ncbi:MAG TPA: nucleoside hydrolase [Chloroflexota bacterium]|nr:nucleoside hydrolase [Chloroflexota bacterium]
MEFPTLPESTRLTLLEPPVGKVAMVLDTDTYNEIDDQFALIYALLSPDRIEVEAVYAAPFHNDRSTGPADGMEKSYDEILRLLSLIGRPHAGFVHRGARAWLPGPDQPIRSAAVADLIERARADRSGPLYVVAIAAPTNVASALLLAPEIRSRMVVIWLGGNATYWPTASEFNLRQDMHASRILFDSGVPLVHVPCLPVTDHLSTTEAEIDRFVRGSGALGDFLAAEYSAYYEDHFGRSKAIWDVGPVAWLVNPAWAESALVPSPILTTERTWSHDPRRHLIREVRYLDRDPIFADLFAKLAASGR